MPQKLTVPKRQFLRIDFSRILVGQKYGPHFAAKRQTRMMCTSSPVEYSADSPTHTSPTTKGPAEIFLALYQKSPFSGMLRSFGPAFLRASGAKTVSQSRWVLAATRLKAPAGKLLLLSSLLYILRRSGDAVTCPPKRTRGPACAKAPLCAGGLFRGTGPSARSRGSWPAPRA